MTNNLATEPATKILNFDPLSISIDERIILMLIGYPQAHQPAAQVDEALPRLMQTAGEMALPKALHGLYDLQSVSRDAVNISEGPSFSGSRVAAAMQGADKALLFVLTLGLSASEFSRELAENDPFEAFLFDAIASVMVESLANDFQDEMERKLGDQGLHGGLRYSPGYCDWPVVENPALLHFIAAEKIDIATTEGGMMHPEKSISGMIGYGPDKEKVKINPCISCKRSECNHRRDLALV